MSDEFDPKFLLVLMVGQEPDQEFEPLPFEDDEIHPQYTDFAALPYEFDMLQQFGIDTGINEVDDVVPTGAFYSSVTSDPSSTGEEIRANLVMGESLDALLSAKGALVYATELHTYKELYGALRTYDLARQYLEQATNTIMKYKDDSILVDFFSQPSTADILGKDSNLWEDQLREFEARIYFGKGKTMFELAFLGIHQGKKQEANRFATGAEHCYKSALKLLPAISPLYQEIETALQLTSDQFNS